MIGFRNTGSMEPPWAPLAITIDGAELHSSRVSYVRDDRERSSVTVYDADDSRKLFPVTLKDLGTHFESVSLSLDDALDRWLTLETVYFELRFHGRHKLTLTLTVDYANWANPFSVLGYLHAFKEAAGGSPLGHAIPVEDPEDINTIDTLSIRLVYDLPTEQLALGEPPPPELPDQLTLGKLILQELPEIKRVSSIAAEIALEKVRETSVVTWFNFPGPIKAACEQYLVYFVQFLEDLGIKANTEIKEDAGRVLFSCTPEEGPSALQRIKDALEIYLNLPRSPGFRESASRFDDLAVIQLKSQVFFLQSQLELAKATVQAKDAAIQALDFTVFQQKQLLTSGVSINPTPEKNEEPILGDTVHLTEYKGKAFRVDLPTIFRRLKRSFGIGRAAAAGKSLPPASSDGESE